MKLIIAGSRDLSGHIVYEPICDFISRTFYEHSEKEDVNLSIVCGMATGVDNEGLNYAINNKLKLHNFSADWSKHGKAAGPIRNREMAEFGDYLLLIWDGKSRGSASMKREMEKLGKPVWEIIIEE